MHCNASPPQGYRPNSGQLRGKPCATLIHSWCPPLQQSSCLAIDSSRHALPTCMAAPKSCLSTLTQVATQERCAAGLLQRQAAGLAPRLAEWGHYVSRPSRWRHRPPPPRLRPAGRGRPLLPLRGCRPPADCPGAAALHSPPGCCSAARPRLRPGICTAQGARPSCAAADGDELGRHGDVLVATIVGVYIDSQRQVRDSSSQLLGNMDLCTGILGCRCIRLLAGAVCNTAGLSATTITPPPPLAPAGPPERYQAAWRVKDNPESLFLNF